MRAWLELIRLPAVFTAPADVLAGFALVGLTPLAPGAWPIILGLVLASLCVYAAGMAANDVFDADLDAVERPGRPLPSGRISTRGAMSLVLGLQLLALSVAYLAAGLVATAAVGGTIIATSFYNGLLKHSALGPLTMGLCRFGNACIGLSAAGVAGLTGSNLEIPAVTVLYVASLTGVSRSEVHGSGGPRLRWPLMGLLLTSLHPALWVALGRLPSNWGALAALAAPVMLLGPVRRAWGGGAGPVRGAVMAGIFGIALVNAAIAVGAGQLWAAATIAALALAGRLIGRRFYAT